MITALKGQKAVSFVPEFCLPFPFFSPFYWQIYMLIGTFGRSEKGEMLVVGGEIMLNRLTFR